MAKDAPEKLQALVRSLNLVPYFRSHPNKTVFEAAADLGMTAQEVKDGMEALFCTGVGQHTEEMLDGRVSNWRDVVITEDQGLNRPLRLTPTEAGALLLMLESLEATPGLIDDSAVVSAAAKIRSIMDEKTAAIYDTLAQPDPSESEAGSLVTEALDRGLKLEFDYWSSHSNSTKHRTASPARVFIGDSEVYFIGWDDESSAHRTFRLDRMSNVELSAEKSTPNLSSLSFTETDPFGFSAADTARVSVHKEFTWLQEEFHMDLDSEPKNGWFAGTMPYTSMDWLVRFALTYSDALRVLSPETATTAISQRRQSAIDRYTQ